MKPQDAACIIEADVNVDFDAPVGYKEPERVPVVPPKPVLPEVQRAKEGGAEEVEDKGPKFTAFSGAGLRYDGKALKPDQVAAAPTVQVSGSSRSAVAATAGGGSGGGHNWGEGAGSLAKGNVAAERRAAAAKAAEARALSSSSSSSLSAGHSPPPAASNTGGIGGATKWSKSAKLGHFQAGSGNKMT